MRRFSILVAVLSLSLSLVAQVGAKDKRPKTRFVTIGTGSMTGVYFPTGNAIAKMVNGKFDEYGLKVTAESTGGSVFNIKAVLAGDLDFGIAQSDRQFQAMKGLAEWQGKAQGKLRAVFSIHPECVTLVAAADAGIVSLADLKGKRVNIGNPGSGQRQNAIDAFTYAGIDYRKDLDAESVKAAEGPGLLQDDRIDAFFFTVGHPNGNIKEATAGRRKVRFVSITGMEKLLEKNPYYASATIPIKDYPQAVNKGDVKTFGVKATLVTSSDVPEDMVYAVVKEVFDNLDEFKTLHPAYGVLTKQNMLEGLSAPIHRGAMKYYREAGLVK